jgi:hypothetical protein
MLKARREGRSFQIAVKRPAVGERMALIAKRLNPSRTFEKRSPLAAEKNLESYMVSKKRIITSVAAELLAVISTLEESAL